MKRKYQRKSKTNVRYEKYFSIMGDAQIKLHLQIDAHSKRRSNFLEQRNHALFHLRDSCLEQLDEIKLAIRLKRMSADSLMAYYSIIYGIFIETEDSLFNLSLEGV